jgi:putative membrane protein
MERCDDARVDRSPMDASRRTYLAEERTLLAWWRSGLAALAVALAVGRLLPALVESDSNAPFVGLGVAYALLGLGMVVFGSVRERTVAKALAEGRFAPLPIGVVFGLTAYLAVLAIATIVLVVAE